MMTVSQLEYMLESLPGDWYIGTDERFSDAFDHVPLFVFDRFGQDAGSIDLELEEYNPPPGKVMVIFVRMNGTIEPRGLRNESDYPSS